MRLQSLQIKSPFKNLENLFLDFTDKQGISILIGNNGSGKSNVLEAISAIFTGLYDQSFNPDFDYEMTFSKDNHDIQFNFTSGVYNVLVDGRADNIKREYLPSQVIGCYSGEENRLWKNYYQPFYQNYIRAIKGATIPNLDLMYIDKNYWEIALLTFYYFDFSVFTDIKSFCEETLGINTVESVTLTFDLEKIKKWRQNPVVNLVRALNPNNLQKETMTLDEVKSRTSFLSSEIDFFKYLVAAHIPENDKIIKQISLNFNNGLTTESLSEGEKKLLLVKLILEVVGDENSLILLDEPDSHIHVSRKKDFKDLLLTYSNRENVITTHSPTLTHCFDIHHIIMLSKDENNLVQVEAKEKQEIVHHLTDGIWTYQEQNIFLNSSNDILLVEGKSDEVFLRKALEVLKPIFSKFSSLNFEYLPCGGADGIILMSKKFSPKPGQKIIALLDRDGAGWSAINRIFECSSDNQFNNGNFGRFRKKDNVWVAPYPKRAYYGGTDNFNVEDYFSKAKLNELVMKTFKNLDTIVTKQAVKRQLESKCHTFPDSEFKHFSRVFDLILEIKTMPD